ncbi:hypothetical protein CJ178_30765 [Rhodococcus sp. ACPA4]|nr:hypothetical protein CJ178_30765 [Rhodococcus sp. ACPA4]ROZ42923.1 hypothetical protein EEB13_30965 [Rhodococcus sp. WS3]RZL20917.1 MAG: hypothetical protein EOP31_30440 [Rhodococcus sp. (in: high G+C Gram-positive bacteria)]
MAIGSVNGQHNVPVSVVDEESLLIEVSRRSTSSEILIAIPNALVGTNLEVHRERLLASQVCRGGPIRQMLIATGAHSVLVPMMESTAHVA